MRMKERSSFVFRMKILRNDNLRMSLNSLRIPEVKKMIN